MYFVSRSIYLFTLRAWLSSNSRLLLSVNRFRTLNAARHRNPEWIFWRKTLSVRQTSWTSERETSTFPKHDTSISTIHSSCRTNVEAVSPKRQMARKLVSMRQSFVSILDKFYTCCTCTKHILRFCAESACRSASNPQSCRQVNGRRLPVLHLRKRTLWQEDIHGAFIFQSGGTTCARIVELRQRVCNGPEKQSLRYRPLFSEKLDQFIYYSSLEPVEAGNLPHKR